MNDYIVLTNSGSTLVKRFRVLLPGFSPIREKVGTIRTTVTGKVDNQCGPILGKWQFVIRAYETDPLDPTKSDTDTEGYGTLAHLKTFFDYNEPPSNLLTLTDFDESTYGVYLVGVLSEKPLTPKLEGQCAFFDVPITIVASEALA